MLFRRHEDWFALGRGGFLEKCWFMARIFRLEARFSQGGKRRQPFRVFMARIFRHEGWFWPGLAVEMGESWFMVSFLRHEGWFVLSRGGFLGMRWFVVRIFAVRSAPSSLAIAR